MNAVTAADQPCLALADCWWIVKKASWCFSSSCSWLGSGLLIVEWTSLHPFEWYPLYVLNWPFLVCLHWAHYISSCALLTPWHVRALVAYMCDHWSIQIHPQSNISSTCGEVSWTSHTVLTAQSYVVQVPGSQMVIAASYQCWPGGGAG